MYTNFDCVFTFDHGTPSLNVSHRVVKERDMLLFDVLKVYTSPFYF